MSSEVEMEKIRNVGEYQLWTNERGELILRNNNKEDILLYGDIRYFVRALLAEIDRLK